MKDRFSCVPTGYVDYFSNAFLLTSLVFMAILRNTFVTNDESFIVNWRLVDNYRRVPELHIREVFAGNDRVNSGVLLSLCNNINQDHEICEER